jgi:hypothetical protein
VRTGRAGCSHTCRPCVGVAHIIADGNPAPAYQLARRPGGDPDQISEHHKIVWTIL